jgi:hypothetical protein
MAAAIRMLALSPENKKTAEAIVEYASKPEHYYKPPTDWVPGDQPEYTCRINDYRCVFTITEQKDGKRFRHLSMSVPAAGKLPNVVAACTIATWFGFTGAPMYEDIATRPGLDWQVHISEEERCIVLAQLLP